MILMLHGCRKIEMIFSKPLNPTPRRDPEVLPPQDQILITGDCKTSVGLASTEHTHCEASSHNTRTDPCGLLRTVKEKPERM
jgi:hypothetical protein